MKAPYWLFAFALLCPARAAAQDSQLVAVIEWSPSRKLAITDFKGRIPAGATDASISQVSIQVAWECHAGAAQFDVHAIFDPSRSWWRDLVPNLWQNLDAPFTPMDDRGASLLAHEQLHFDLTEVWARRMTRALLALRSGCGTPDGEAAIDKTVAEVEKRWGDEQRRYDRDTNNGVDSRQQKAWGVRTAKALDDQPPAGSTPAAR